MNSFSKFAFNRIFKLLYFRNELRVTSRVKYLLHVLSGGNSINRLKD